MIRFLCFLNVLALAVAFVVAAPVIATELPPDVVAKVGSLSISERDLQREIQKLLPMQVSYHGGIKPEKLAEVRKEALQALIDRAYKFQYAVTEEISVPTADFKAAWETYLQKSGARVSDQRDLERLRAGYYQETLAALVEKQVVDANVKVSDEDVKSYYEGNKEKYFRPRLYRASHIFVKIDPSAPLSAKEERRKFAESLYEKALAGEDFYNLAYYNSDDRTRYVGGSLGQFHAGQTVREFDAALADMKAGDISPPVETIYGFHVIKLDTVEESRQLSYEEAAGLLRQQMQDKARQELYDRWMTSLRDTYPLVVRTKE